MSATPKTRRWTNALLVGQFALTLALLSGAGLTGKAFYKAYALDRNVQTSDAVTTFVRLPPQTCATPEQRLAFHQQLRDRLLAVPEITASAVASAAPFSSRWQAQADRRGWTAHERSAPGRHDPGRGARLLSHRRSRPRLRRVLLRVARDSRARGGDREPAIRRRVLVAGSPIGHHLELRPPTAQRTYLRGRRPRAASSRDDRRRVSATFGRVRRTRCRWCICRFGLRRQLRSR